ncbi:MAG: c-type cytochrome [Myxococcota bacterium]
MQKLPWCGLVFLLACTPDENGTNPVPAPQPDPIVDPDPDPDPDPTPDPKGNPFATARGTVPIYGGTLALSDGRVYVADPALDNVFFAPQTLETDPVAIALPKHTEPFRIAAAGDDLYVTLRGTGEVAHLDVASQSVVATTPICAEPRGVTLTDGGLFVACASGELVELTRKLEIVRSVELASDLRDVVLEGTHLWVSTFRDASVLRVSLPDLTIVQEARPDLSTTEQPQQEPHVAWRMRAHPTSGVVLLHQGATREPIPQEQAASNGNSFNGDGESRYGGKLCDPAGAISSSHFTHVTETATTTGGANGLGNSQFDFAMGQGLVFTANGVVDGRTPPSQRIGLAIDILEVAVTQPQCVMRSFDEETVGVTITALEMASDGTMFTYSREPAVLSNGTRRVTLNAAVADGPLNTFHMQTDAFIACASCHPEGQEDGHVWEFEESGLRRTQSLAGGLADRAPFHWDGEFGSLPDLMGDVFVDRMGGAELTETDTTVLLDWLHAIPVPRSAPVDAARVAEGRALFESAGCAECHAGDALTDSQLHVVRGGSEARKTPSLLGIASRAPYMSDGCAPTLEDRMTDPQCGGGDLHGQTSTLSSDEQDVLIAYLKSL